VKDKCEGNSKDIFHTKEKELMYEFLLVPIITIFVDFSLIFEMPVITQSKQL